MLLILGTSITKTVNIIVPDFLFIIDDYQFKVDMINLFQIVEVTYTIKLILITVKDHVKHRFHNNVITSHFKFNFLRGCASSEIVGGLLFCGSYTYQTASNE